MRGKPQWGSWSDDANPSLNHGERYDNRQGLYIMSNDSNDGCFVKIVCEYLCGLENEKTVFVISRTV